MIIFDEVQECPLARQAIKKLVKDHRYDYIETGSLISIKKNTKNIAFLQRLLSNFAYLLLPFLIKTELRDAFDNAIRQLKASGKLRQISIDVIGGDYTEAE